MDRRRWLLSAAGLLIGAPTLAEAASPAAANASGIAGKWTYRSFHNRPALVDGDPEKALRLIFAEAFFTFEIDGTLRTVISSIMRRRIGLSWAIGKPPV